MFAVVYYEDAGRFKAAPILLPVPACLHTFVKVLKFGKNLDNKEELDNTIQLFFKTYNASR